VSAAAAVLLPKYYARPERAGRRSAGAVARRCLLRASRRPGDSGGRRHPAAERNKVFSAAGQHLGTIPLSRAPQNLAFAGADKKTLYIVGRGVAFKVRLLTEGFKGRAK
jgi:hypothetical protein